MENNTAFQLLDHENKQSNSVISFPQGQTFKIGKLLEKVNTLFKELTLSQLPERLNQEGLGRLPIYNGRGWDTQHWNQHGVESEILDPDGGWKKGKVRMRVVLEFCPDEPEEIASNDPENNSLNDIRKTIS